jgi:hypothetical protein
MTDNIDTTRYVESMRHTARALEELGRKIGYYGRDCDTLDTALKSGKRHGFAVLFNGDSTEPEIFPLGDNHGEVKLEKGNTPESWTCSYEQLHENQLAKRVAAGKSVREEHEDVKPMHVGDERRAKIADAKREYQAGCARTAEVAARMKAEAAKLWGNKFPA